MDYKDLGFNQFMEKNPYIDNTRFSSLQAKGVFPVGSISFDKASGGTLVIGGKDNAGGVISVRDDDSTEKVLINSSGITITDGKITVQDQNGTTIIDGVGLVSSGSFTFDSVEGAVGNQTENSATYTDITGISLSFTLTRSAQVLFFYQTAAFIARNLDDTTDVAANVRLVLDDAATGTVMEIIGHRFVTPWGAAATRGSTDMAWATGYGQQSMAHYSSTVSAGAHTAKMQFRSSAGGYTAYVFKQFTRLSYLILGK